MVSLCSVSPGVNISTGYLTRILAGQVELRMAHVLSVCRIIDFPVGHFFAALFPPEQESEAKNRLSGGLAQLHPGPVRHRNTGRFESALRFLTTAIEAQRPIGRAHDETRTYNLLGMVYLDAGDRPQALRAFRTALRLIGPNTPIDLVVSTGHNMFETLIAAGRFSAASAALVSLEPYYGRLTSARLSAKAEWMRARLCRGLRQLPAAELAYERAYAILSTEARAGELADLVKEMTAPA